MSCPLAVMTTLEMGSGADAAVEFCSLTTIKKSLTQSVFRSSTGVPFIPLLVAVPDAMVVVATFSS